MFSLDFRKLGLVQSVMAVESRQCE